jgi:hypothetical protein
VPAPDPAGKTVVAAVVSPKKRDDGRRLSGDGNSDQLRRHVFGGDRLAVSHQVHEVQRDRTPGHRQRGFELCACSPAHPIRCVPVTVIRVTDRRKMIGPLTLHIPTAALEGSLDIGHCHPGQSATHCASRSPLCCIGSALWGLVTPAALDVARRQVHDVVGPDVVRGAHPPSRP